MTFRAIILGMLGAAFIAAGGYLNDSVLRLNMLVGNHFPISVFGMLVLVLLTVNPLLGLVCRRMQFRPRELAVMLALVLGACSIPGSSMMRMFTPAVSVPILQNRNEVGWQANRVLDYIPDAMLPAGGEDDPRFTEGLVSGLGEPGDPMGLDRVPWDLWVTPLAVWMSIFLLAAVAMVCIALIVHRQWSRHERLRYPVALFADSLLSATPGGDEPPIFRRGLFWIGVVTMLVIHLVNGVHAWYPGSIEIPLEFDFTLIGQKWPFFVKTWHGRNLLTPDIWPMVIALAFFLSSDVSFSLGISAWVFVLIVSGLLTAGVDMREHWFEGGLALWQRFGSYFGVGLVLLYTGRRYYGQVLRRAVTFLPSDRAESYAAWAMRGLIAAVVTLTAILTGLGLNWMLAMLAVGLVLLQFTVISRINVESGLFFVQPFWLPGAVLLGVFGYEALGPAALAIVSLFGAVMALDAREVLMPFVVNALKICDDQGVRPRRIGRWVPVAFAVGLGAAVPVVLWANYNYGLPWDDGWATSMASFTPGGLDRAITHHRATGAQPAAGDISALGRLVRMSPSGDFLWASGIGVGLVLLFGMLRLRYPRWPLHPLIFLVWGTWAMDVFCHSFLLGWLIKTTVVRFGGARAYRRGMTFMVGVISGELLAGLGWMIQGAIYYAATGAAPEVYRVLPG